MTTERDTNSVNVCKSLMKVTAKLNGCGGTPLLVDTGVGCNILYEKTPRKVGATVNGSCRKIVGISRMKIFTLSSVTVSVQVSNVT